MANNKGIPWLLLAGLAALIYFIIKNQRPETPSSYPYPVAGTTSGSLTPSAGVVAPTPTTPAQTTPVIRPSRNGLPQWTQPALSQSGLAPIVTAPPPSRGGIPRWVSSFVPMRPLEYPTVNSPQVLGRPAPAPSPVYDTSGGIIGYQGLPPMIIG